MDDFTRALERLAGEIRYARRIAKAIIDGRRAAQRMSRVGFRGIQKYGELSEATLDQGADKLADRYDMLVAKGDSVFKAKNKELDGHEAHLTGLEATMAAISNGAPPLDDAAPQPSASQPEPESPPTEKKTEP